MAVSKEVLAAVTDLARRELAAEDEVKKARARVYHVDATAEDIDQGTADYLRANQTAQSLRREIWALEKDALKHLDPDGHEAGLIRQEIKYASMIPTFERDDAARGLSSDLAKRQVAMTKPTKDIVITARVNGRKDIDTKPCADLPEAIAAFLKKLGKYHEKTPVHVLTLAVGIRTVDAKGNVEFPFSPYLNQVLRANIQGCLVGANIAIASEHVRISDSTF